MPAVDFVMVPLAVLLSVPNPASNVPVPFRFICALLRTTVPPLLPNTPVPGSRLAVPAFNHVPLTDTAPLNVDVPLVVTVWPTSVS